MYEEYKNLVDSLIKTPDTAIADVQGVLDKLKAELTTMDSLKADNEAMKDKIKTLQDTNIKLYMSQGSAPVVKEEEKEKTEEEQEVENVESFFNELQGGE